MMLPNNFNRLQHGSVVPIGMGVKGHSIKVMQKQLRLVLNPGLSESLSLILTFIMPVLRGKGVAMVEFFKIDFNPLNHSKGAFKGSG